MNKILGIVIVCLIGLLIFIYSNTFIIGKTINKFFPCKQNPMNSFPCYGVYDLWAMGIILGLIVILAIVLIVRRTKIFG